MKFMKRVLSLILVACTALSLVVTAHAEETDDDKRFKDKTWEEVVQDFLHTYNTDESKVALGYLNLVTGEEHYVNADEYMVAASMYKVPLNMVYAERVSKGEMTWDSTVSGVQLAKLTRGSIVASNNEFSDYLRAGLGGYPTYRRYFAEYMGEDPDTVDEKFYENNYFTARQMITCLKTLYEGGEERFPDVVSYMKESEPNNYFNFVKQDFPLAHKYGYLIVNDKLELNDCAIVYTDDPIAIVMFTLGVNNVYTVMGEYCALMADYTQYHTKLRLIEEEKKEAEEAAKRAEEEAIAALNASDMHNQGEKTQWTLDMILADRTLRMALILCGVVLVIALIALIVVLVAGAKGKIKRLAGCGAIGLFTLSMLVCIIAPNTGIIVCAPTGDPQDVVVAFFDALIEGDYETAYSYLDYYSGLGLENQPEGEANQVIYEALKDSYSYRLYGDCVTGQLTAKQQVLLEHLDIQRMQTKLGDKTHDVLEKMVQTSASSAIYDENNEFRPEAIDTAYLAAVNELLEQPELYRSTTGMELNLVYTSDGWRIEATTDLLNALTGGIAY